MPFDPTDPGDEILVADDDPLVRNLLCHWLGAEGYRVAAVPSGAAALAYLRARPLPRLLLLDAHMRPGDGREVLQAIKSDPRLQRLPVAMISGVVSLDTIARDTWLTPDYYLAKPLDRAELRRILAEACGPPGQPPAGVESAAAGLRVTRRPARRGSPGRRSPRRRSAPRRPRGG